MARAAIAAHREFMGFDVFYERHHTGLHWTGRDRHGFKLRADTLAGLKEGLRQSAKGGR
jgi:hypothetical protein